MLHDVKPTRTAFVADLPFNAYGYYLESLAVFVDFDWLKQQLDRVLVMA
jgi:hypothetical protein